MSSGKSIPSVAWPGALAILTDYFRNYAIAQ